LKTYQFKLAEESVICESLRQEIQRLGPFAPCASSVASTGEKYHGQQLHQLCEVLRQRINLLKEEKSRKESSIKGLGVLSEKLAQETENRSKKLV